MRVVAFRITDHYPRSILFDNALMERQFLSCKTTITTSHEYNLC